MSGVKRAAERGRESGFQQRLDGSQAGVEMEVGEECCLGNPEWGEERRRSVSVTFEVFQKRAGCLWVSDFPSPCLSFLI